MKYLYALAILAIGELISLFLFAIIRRWLGPAESSSAGRASIAKGILERLLLFTGLLFGFPQVLIAFGALKLGTRLVTEQQNKISNDYFFGRQHGLNPSCLGLYNHCESALEFLI